MPSSQNTSIPQLAADVLDYEQYSWVEATTPGVELSGTQHHQKQILLNLEALKIEMGTANKSLKDFHNTVDSKITMVNENISDLLIELKKNNSLLEDQAKMMSLLPASVLVEEELKKNNHLLEYQVIMKRLELASTRTHLWSFSYKVPPDEYERNSADLVENIIDCFMVDASYLLPPAFVEDQTRDDMALAEKEERFRKEIMFQISKLVGRCPRLEETSNGTFSIWLPTTTNSQ